MDKDLTQIQLEIMQILWEKENGAMYAEISEALRKKNRKWKTNTVLTFLSRMADKGLLKIEKQGRLNCYQALVSKQEYQKKQTEFVVEQVFDGNARHLVSALFQQEYLNKEDFKKLEKFWREGEDTDD